MKTLKTILLGLALLVVSGVTAAAKPAPEKLSKSDVLNLYVEASINGKLSGLAGAIADEVVFNIVRGENVVTSDKKTLLNFFKATENIKQACEVKTTTIEDEENTSTIRLEMKYPTSTRISLITMENTNKGWKITKVQQSVK